MILAALGLCVIGGLLYFVVLGNALPGRGDSTSADGGTTVEEATPPVGDDAVETGDDGDGEAGGAGDGEAGGEDPSTDDEVAPETTVVDEAEPETTIAVGLSSDLDGILDPAGIVLVGTASTQDEVDRLVERLSALSPSGSVDASAVVVDPASPPVRELALTVSDQIVFAVNSDEIETDFIPILDRVVEFMQADQTISIAVLGHTDADGIDFENLALSQRRAEAVVAYLIEQGVNSFRLEPLGRGSTEPVASNDTLEGRALNRRIEFTILGLDI